MRGLASAHVWFLRALHQIVEGEARRAPLFADKEVLPDEATGQSAGPVFIVEEFSDEPWASLTYSGTRHQLCARIDGREEEVDAAYARVLELLEEPEIVIPGYFLAEITLTQGECRELGEGLVSRCFDIEALTIAE